MGGGNEESSDANQTILQNIPYTNPNIETSLDIESDVRYDEMKDFSESIPDYETVTTIPTNYLPKYVNTMKCTNWHSAFSGMSNLQSLPDPFYNTSNMKNMGDLFFGCTSLNLNSPNVFQKSDNNDLAINRVTRMNGAFSQVKQIQYNSININCNNCDMHDLFERTNIETNSISISTANNTQGMFYSTTINFPSNVFDMQISVDGESIVDMFLDCNCVCNTYSNAALKLNNVTQASEAFMNSYNACQYLGKYIMECDTVKNMFSCFESSAITLPELNFPKNAVNLKSAFYNCVINNYNSGEVIIHDKANVLSDLFLDSTIVGQNITNITVYSNTVRNCSSFVGAPLTNSPLPEDSEVVVTNIKCYENTETWNSFYTFLGNNTVNYIYGMQLIPL